MNKLHPAKLISLALLVGFVVFFTSQMRAQSIVAAEYFIDADPGPGRGTPLSFSSPSAEVEERFSIPTQGLTPGIHRLVVRVKDEQGTWSMSTSQRFFVEGKPETPPAPAQIVRLEYFLNQDPGVGRGTSIAVNNPQDSVARTLNIRLPTSLPRGKHRIGVRAQDSNGNWSLTQNAQIFLPGRDRVEAIENPQIVAIEYFINSPDPGQGKATSLSISQEGNQVVGTGTLSINDLDLTLGRHQIIARAKDQTGRWSLSTPQDFDICTPDGVIAGFSISASGQTVTITDESQYTQTYSYTLGDGTTQRAASFSHTYDQGGNYTICQTASNLCETEQICETIFISAPRVIAGRGIPGQSFTEDDPERLIVSNLNEIFEDLNGGALTYSASSNRGINARIENNSTLYIQPQPNFDFNAVVTVRATSSNGTFAQLRFNVNVTPVNDPPLLVNPIPDRSYLEDSPPVTAVSNLNNHFREVDNLFLQDVKDTIIYAVSSDTSAVRANIVDNRSLQLSFAANYFGVANITVTATDTVLTSSTTFRVTVIQVIDPPVRARGIADQAFDMNSGEQIVADLFQIFTDADGDVLTYTTVSDNPRIKIYVKEGRFLAVLSDEDYFGDANMFVTATDPTGLSASDQFRVVVRRVARPPRISLTDGSLCPAAPNDRITYDLNANTQDGESGSNEFSFSARVLSVEPTTIPASALNVSISPTEMASISTTTRERALFRVLFSATDINGVVGYDTVNITVLGSSYTEAGNLLTAVEGDSYQWYLNGNPIPGATSRTLTKTTNGAYQVAVTKNGCTVLSPGNSITSLNKLLKGDRVSLFPNPNNGYFEILLEGSLRGKIHLRVFNSSGQEILRKDLEKNIETAYYPLQLPALPKGIYLLQLQAAGEMVVKTWLKE